MERIIVYYSSYKPDLTSTDINKCIIILFVLSNSIYNQKDTKEPWQIINQINQLQTLSKMHFFYTNWLHVQANVIFGAPLIKIVVTKPIKKNACGRDSRQT